MTVEIDHGEWYRDEAGEFRFRIVAVNNKILSWGESYKDKGECIETLEALTVGAVGNPRIIEGRSDRSTPKPRIDETDGGLRAD